MKNLQFNSDSLENLSDANFNLNRTESRRNVKMTGYASIDKPWMKWHEMSSRDESEDIYIAKETNFCDYFMKMISFYPDDKILLDYCGKKYSVADIKKEVSKQMIMFRNYGIKSGDTVSFLTNSVPEVLFMFLALNKLGVVVNLIKFDEPASRIDDLLNIENMDFQVKKSNYFIISETSSTIDFIGKAKEVLNLNSNLKNVIVLNDSMAPLTKEQEEALNSNPRFLRYDEYQEKYDLTGKSEILAEQIFGKNKSSKIKMPEVSRDNVALIVYTGGSTGPAKGVALTNHNLMASCHGMKYSDYGFTEEKVAMDLLPASVAYWFNASLGSMVCGMQVYLIPEFEIPKYSELLDSIKPNVDFGGPILLKILRDSKVKDLSYFSDPISGGDKLDGSEEETIDKSITARGAGPVRQFYGSNEVTAMASGNPTHLKKIGSIGIPMVNVTMAIFEYQTDKEIPYGQNIQGEICFTGPTVMKGYVNNSEETKNVKLVHSDGTVWVHSDDFGIQDADGFIYHKGRAKRMITRSGVKFWLSRLEEEVKMLNVIKDCCATKLPDDYEREVPVLHVVLKDGMEDDLSFVEKIDSYINQNMQLGYMPKYYVIWDELPYSETNKKLDFKSLEALNILDTDNFLIEGRIIRPRRKLKKIS